MRKYASLGPNAPVVNKVDKQQVIESNKSPRHSNILCMSLKHITSQYAMCPYVNSAPAYLFQTNSEQ